MKPTAREMVWGRLYAAAFELELPRLAKTHSPLTYATQLAIEAAAEVADMGIEAFDRRFVLPERDDAGDITQ